MENIKNSLFSLLLMTTLCHFSMSQAGNYETGVASYYASEFHGKKTASGEIYNMNALTAAHPTLPFNTYVKVTNLSNNKSVIVRINDRGPHTKKRVIDLSKAAAKKIGLIQAGVAKVRIELIEDPNNVLVKEESEKTEVSEKEIKKEDLSIESIKNLKPTGIYTTDGTKKRIIGYIIQTGAFTDPSLALNHLQKIQQEKGMNTYIEVVSAKKQTVYRILSGPEKTDKEAKAVLEKLKKSGYKGFVRKL